MRRFTLPVAGLLLVVAVAAGVALWGHREAGTPAVASEGSSVSASWGSGEALLLRRSRLLFVRWVSEAQRDDIWISKGDGTGQRLLIENGEAPAWSPDHKRIAFFRDRSLWVADADGGNQQRLVGPWLRTGRWPEDDTDWEAGTLGASWDPRAPRLTFSHEEKFGVKPLSGGQKAELTGCTIFDALLGRPGPTRVHFDLLDDEARCNFSRYAMPTWSPSGRCLAYVRNGDIWVAERFILDERAHGGRDPGNRTWAWQSTRLVAAAQYDAPTDRGSRENYLVTRLSWSPDEQLLAYGIQRIHGSGFWEVRVVRLQRPATNDEELKVLGERTLAEGVDPCFSPDGRFVAYCGEAEGGLGDLWLVSVDGTVRQRFIKDAGWPEW